MKKSITFCFLFSFLVFVSGCSAYGSDQYKSFLNYEYSLVRAGDLHGLPPTSDEVLDRNPGYESFLNLFDKTNSIINFQCLGTNYDNFHCEASFYLYNSSNVLIKGIDSFVCRYTGDESGFVIFEDKEVEEELGTIYVYTPYWCRWQIEYDVSGDGDIRLLTLEFWKRKYNALPDFFNSGN